MENSAHTLAESEWCSLPHRLYLLIVFQELVQPWSTCQWIQGRVQCVRHRRFLFQWYRTRGLGRCGNTQSAKDPVSSLSDCIYWFKLRLTDLFRTVLLQ
jgi:hypothetical protein